MNHEELKISFVCMLRIHVNHNYYLLGGVMLSNALISYKHTYTEIKFQTCKILQKNLCT